MQNFLATCYWGTAKSITFAAVTKSTEAAFQASPGWAPCLNADWYLEVALATNLKQIKEEGGGGRILEGNSIHITTLLSTHLLALCL